MRRRLRALMAALCSLPLALAAAPSAHAADPTGMTSGFYVDPDNSAKRWAAANPGDGRASAINASIANTPMARWFGAWSGSIGTATGAFAGAADSLGAGGGHVTSPAFTTVVPRMTSSSMSTL